MHDNLVVDFAQAAGHEPAHPDGDDQSRRTAHAARARCRAACSSWGGEAKLAYQDRQATWRQASGELTLMLGQIKRALDESVLDYQATRAGQRQSVPLRAGVTSGPVSALTGPCRARRHRVRLAVSRTSWAPDRAASAGAGRRGTPPTPRRRPGPAGPTRPLSARRTHRARAAPAPTERPRTAGVPGPSAPGEPATSVSARTGLSTP